MKRKAFIKDISFFILLFSFGLFISLLLFFSPSMSETIYLLVLFCVFIFLVLLLLRSKRKEELSEIKNVIQKIRNNKYESSDDIVLSESLVELQEEIRAMFSRTQSDIQNLKKLEQVRTEFLGNVSHELRTPIFSIQGYIETLLEGALEDSKVNRIFLQKAFNHTNNLNTLLNDLINISMIESGQMKMSFRFFNIHEFLTGYFNEFKNEAEKKNLTMKLFSQNTKLELFGDKQRLGQVISNLVTNAIKYTEQGYIEIGVIEEEKCATIFVKDTGIGISEKDQPRIFERFYRVDKDRSREQGGTGLGLAIAKHIIEAHSSKLEVKSVYGEGSEFTFQLKKEVFSKT